MTAKKHIPSRLSDVPLSRLIVELDAAERAYGPDSSTARVLARALRERLQQSPPVPADESEAAHA